MFRSQPFVYFSKSKSVVRNKCIENKKKFTLVKKRQFHTFNNGPNNQDPNNPDYSKLFLGSLLSYYTMKMLYKK